MTKEYSLLIYLSIACYLTGYTQILYNKQDSLTNNFYSISEEVGNSNLLITNIKKSLESNGDFKMNTQFLRISNAGTLIDSIQVDTNFATYGRTLVDNNFYYVYGSKYIGTNINTVKSLPTLIKYDPNFNIVAKADFNTYNGMTVGLSQTSVLKGNRIYLFFSLQHTFIKCYKLDLSLNKLDSATFNGLFLYDAINYGNKLMVCGADFPNPSPLGRLQVHELDTAFNLVSYFNMDSLTNVIAGATPMPNSGCSSKIGIDPTRGNLLELSGNKYLVSGYYPVPYTSTCQKDNQNITSIIKNNSQVVKTNIMGKQNGTHEATTAYTSASKKYNYLYTVSKSGANLQNPISPQNVLTEIMVTKLDTNGNVIWNNFYSTPNFYYDPYSICGTSDSGVAVCGVRYNISNPTITGVCEGFVMKLDKNGNQVYTGINDKEITNANTFNLFPNPTINEAYIQFPHLENELEINIKVIDMLGKLVYQTAKTINNNSEIIAIDTKSLTSGLYNVTVSSNKGIVTKKLSVTK